MITDPSSKSYLGYLKFPQKALSSITPNLLPESIDNSPLKRKILFNNTKQVFHKTGILSITKNNMLRIGRNPKTNTLVVSNPFVSADHCCIWAVQFDDSSAPLIYLKNFSANGVYVNSRRIAPKTLVILENHDEIELKSAFKAVFKVNPQYVKGNRVSSSATAQGLDQNAGEIATTVEANQANQLWTEIAGWAITTKVLGSGTFGNVYVGEKLPVAAVGDRRTTKGMTNNHNFSSSTYKPTIKQDENKVICAVKVLKGNNFAAQIKEAEILASLDHPNVVKVFDTIYEHKQLYIFEELVCGGDLFAYLARTDCLSPVPEPEALLIAYQIFSAMHYLHTNNIVHRDLKLDNILLASPEKSTKIVIADFGTACQITHQEQRMYDIVGTPEYSAPEVGFYEKVITNNNSSSNPDYDRSPDGYTWKCDMWSIGVILHIILSGISPFYDNGEDISMIKAAKMGKLNFQKRQWEKISTKAKDMVKGSLSLNVDQRFGCKQCLQHPWVAQYEDVLQDIYVNKILK